jgi:hypothetical protein
VAQRTDALLEHRVALALLRHRFAHAGREAQDRVPKAVQAAVDVLAFGATVVPHEGDQPRPIAERARGARGFGVARVFARTGPRRSQADARRPIITPSLDRARVLHVGVERMFAVKADQHRDGIERLVGGVAPGLVRWRLGGLGLDGRLGCLFLFPEHAGLHPIA